MIQIILLNVLEFFRRPLNPKLLAKDGNKHARYKIRFNLHVLSAYKLDSL